MTPFQPHQNDWLARRRAAIRGGQRSHQRTALMNSMTTLACFAAVTAAASATTYSVPGNFRSIQPAINACSSGDTIVVLPGVYSGRGNQDLDFLGKNITVKAAYGLGSVEILVDTSQPGPHRGFKLHSGETAAAVVDGFVIRGGYVPPSALPYDGGGAIYIKNSSPTIQNCALVTNDAEFGAGIYCEGGAPSILECYFADDFADLGGGAIFSLNSSPMIADCVFEFNESYIGGALGIAGDQTVGLTPANATIVNCVIDSNDSARDGSALAIYGVDSTGTASESAVTVAIDNCTIADNESGVFDPAVDASDSPGAIAFGGGSATFSNSILYWNFAEDALTDPIFTQFSTRLTPGGATVVQYSDIQGGYTGPGNISDDPLLSDYLPTALSPTINAGFDVPTTPPFDIFGFSRFGRTDMGAALYEILPLATPVAASINIPFSGEVATFDDDDDGSPETAFTATIDWGDGNVTTGDVTQPYGPGSFYVVSGTNTYASLGTFPVAVTVTAANPAGTPVSASVTGSASVDGGPATYLSVTAPSSATAGHPIPVTVQAMTPYSTVDTHYTGVVQFTISDPRGAIKAAATLTNGVGTVNASFRTAGVFTVTGTDSVDSSITGTTDPITVTADVPAAYRIGLRGTVTVGNPFTFGIQATDRYGNQTFGYNGSAHITSSDALATLPGDVTFTNGFGTAGATTLITLGSQTVTVTDASVPAMTSTVTIPVVGPGPVAAFRVIAPSTATAGTPFNYTVTALDARGFTVTDYAGTIQFSSNDVAATLPAASTLTNGTGTFSATLSKNGRWAIVATDTASAIVKGSSAQILTR